MKDGDKRLTIANFRLPIWKELTLFDQSAIGNQQSAIS